MWKVLVMMASRWSLLLLIWWSRRSPGWSQFCSQFPASSQASPSSWQQQSSSPCPPTCQTQHAFLNKKIFHLKTPRCHTFTHRPGGELAWLWWRTGCRWCQGRCWPCSAAPASHDSSQNPRPRTCFRKCCSLRTLGKYFLKESYLRLLLSNVWASELDLPTWTEQTDGRISWVPVVAGK